MTDRSFDLAASVVLFFNGWQVFVRGQWDTSTFVTSYFPIVSSCGQCAALPCVQPD